MSISISKKIGHPSTCVLATGEVYIGKLEGVDGTFNTLLSSCCFASNVEEEVSARRRVVSELEKPTKISGKNGRTLIRGDHVVYVSFD